MSTINYKVVERHYCERYTTAPHAYFSGKVPIGVYIMDEVTIEITKKTRYVTLDCILPEKNKILKIKVYLKRVEEPLNHEVLTPRTQQTNPNRLRWMNLEAPVAEIIFPVKVQLDKEYKAGERIQLIIKIKVAFKIIPEKKDIFLPSIDLEPVSTTFLDARYWPNKPHSASVSYVLPKGFKAVSMTSEGPDFISDFNGNSFIGWIFRGETREYLRHWFVAQISSLYFLLLYFIIPLSGSLVIIADCLDAAVPPTLIAMLCGSYLVARYYLYDKTLVSPGGDLVILATFITLLFSACFGFDSILLIVILIVTAPAWIAFCLRLRDTTRNQHKNDPLLGIPPRAHFISRVLERFKCRVCK